MNPLLSVLSFGNTDTSSPLATGRLFEREYAGPLAVLVDENTASAAEMIAASLQDYVGAIVVGRPSCGCVTGLFGFTSLPGGGEFAVSRMQIFLTKRGSIERKGVKPDIEVPLTLADLQNSSNDRTLLAAETALLKGGNATPAKVSAIQ
jgi:C-terminal processing protease CtpA/Prc